MQHRAVGDAGGVGGETGIVGQGVEADGLAELAELAVIAHREDEMAVGRRDDLIGRDVGMGVAHALRRAAGDQEIEVLVCEHGHLGVEQRHVDELALAGGLGVAQRRLDGDDRIEA